MRRVDELLGRRVSMRGPALLRVLLGPVVLLHLRPFLADSLHGTTYLDAFRDPYASWYPQLPEAAYIALLWIAAASAVAMAVGFHARAATITTFAIVAYNLFASTTQFHNNRAYLAIVLGLLSLIPTGERAPAWPLWLLRFECSAVYAASATSKLLDRDWFGGTVTWLRMNQDRQDLVDWHVPGWAIGVLTDRDVHTVAAKVVIATELFLALGLWSRRTRYAAVWVAVVFHLTIQLTASIEVFSVLAVSMLTVWAVPSTRDRVVRVDPRTRLARAIRRLDWLARFRLEPAARGAPLEVVDRDGTAWRGTPALALAFSRLPLTAWLALPVRAATARRRPSL